MALRQDLRARRAQAHAASGRESSLALRDTFLYGVHLPVDAVISFYYPLREEIDPRPIMDVLHAQRFQLALPCIQKDLDTLLFRRYAPGDPLVRGVLDIQEPESDRQLVDPDIMVLPVLGFDQRGHRLGLGGGYYDRTLAALRARRKVLAIGIAYAALEEDDLPHAPYDQRVDLIVTENEVIDPSFSKKS